MSLQDRLARAERTVGPAPEDRSATYAMVIQDAQHPVTEEEPARFLEHIEPAGTMHAVFHLVDNGRGERGPHISFGGAGWVDPGPDLRDGHIVGWPNA